MSILTVRDIQGLSAYNNTIRVPAGSKLQVVDGLIVDAGLQIPVWTTDTRPANPNTGTIGFNSSDDIKGLEYYNGTDWISSANPTYPEPVTNGLVLHLDANKTGGYNGSTWTDHSNVIGNVNINNRNSDWQFQTESTTGLTCVYSNVNRIGSSTGMNIPMNNGFSKLAGSIEIWIRPTAQDGGCGWFNNSDGTSYTNNSSWLWWGTWDNSNCHYLRFGNPSTCCNDVSNCSFKASNYYPLNQWMTFTATWNIPAARATIYRNSSVIYNRTNMPTDVPSGHPTNTGQLFNGHNRSDNMQFRGYCSIYRIYNRELSDAEINSNFNTFRSMHNI